MYNTSPCTLQFFSNLRLRPLLQMHQQEHDETVVPALCLLTGFAGTSCDSAAVAESVTISTVVICTNSDA